MNAGGNDGNDGPERRRRAAPRSQFRKGRSGNPKGRPKKKASEPDASSTTSIGAIFIADAERPVTLTEGGKRVTMSAAQAVARANFLAAMKGNAHAQRTYLQIVDAAQAAAAKFRRDEHAGALAFKIELEHQRYQWVARGRDEGDMPQHPSDIELDPRTGDVKNYVLLTDEAVAARSSAIALRDYALQLMPDMLAAAAEGDDLLLQLARERAHRIIDSVNDIVPKWRRRYLPGDHRNEITTVRTPEEIWQAMACQAASLLLKGSSEVGPVNSGEVKAQRNTKRRPSANETD